MTALKQNNEISLFSKGMTDKSPSSSTMEEIYHLIIGNSLHDSTEKFRYFESSGWEEDAKKEKKKAVCFTPSAICKDGHAKKNLVRPTGKCMVDFDNLPHEQLLLAMELLKKDPYVELSYITISDNGIRIIYQTDITEVIHHPYAYSQGNKYYADLLHFEADNNCKDITRCSVLSEDPDAYFNPDAEVMHIELPSEKEIAKTKKKSGRPRKKYSTEAHQAETFVLNELEKQGKEYVEGHYNEYVSSSLYLMNAFGVSEEDASNWAVSQFSDYDSSQVKAIGHSVYQHTDEHGSRPLPRSTASSGSKSPEDYYATIEELEEFIDSQAEVRINLLTHHREILMKGEDDFRSLKDSDENTLWLRAKKAKLHTSYKIFTSILNSEYIGSYHPFFDYVDGLDAWDGVTDYISQVASIVETQDPDYFKTIFKKWFVGFIGSILDPNTINHQILTLIGGEGIYKSTFFTRLFPEHLRTFYLTKVQMTGSFSKDDLTEISEFMLVCLEEIDNMTIAQMNRIKASVTLPNINIRDAYAHNREYRLHNCSFCATGNNHYYLPEGDNRRWLSEYVISIDYTLLDNIPYEGLYAQAVSLFRSGFRYWFNAEESKLVKARNELFKEPNIEEELIREYFRHPLPGEHITLLSTADILGTIGAGLKFQLSTVKIRQSLDKLGFQYKRTNKARGFLIVRLTPKEIAEKQHFKSKETENNDPTIPF